MTTLAPVLHIALDRLALCLDEDCRATFDLRLTTCPACGGTALYTLARWLAREGAR